MGSAAWAVGAKLAKTNTNNHIKASSERDAALRAAAALAPDPVISVVDGSIELFRQR
jgi:hypothetical protein